MLTPRSHRENLPRPRRATVVTIDPRNPYKALQEIFLDHPFVVLSENVVNPLDRWRYAALELLSSHFGYRYAVYEKETLEEAVRESQYMLQVNPRYSSDLQQLTLDEAIRLYSLLEKVDRVLTDHHIGYWAGRETLLGAIRHGGLIPWDDYLHLFLLDTDEQKLLNARSDLESVGLALHAYYKGIYKIHEIDGIPLEDSRHHTGFLPFKYPAVNLFVMRLEHHDPEQDIYVHRSADFYVRWSHERFAYSQTQGITRAPFGPLTISIPGDPESYLRTIYGVANHPDLWRKYAIESTWDHRREDKARYPGAALVEIDHFSPAPWRESDPAIQ